MYFKISDEKKVENYLVYLNNYEIYKYFGNKNYNHKKLRSVIK